MTVIRRQPFFSMQRVADTLHWLFLLFLCSAYLQGGITKAFNFDAALAEMRHFGLHPAGPFALLTIVGELGASLMILSGRLRWLGALYLATFTLAANLMANRFWELSGAARIMSENGFFEHIGLVGGFLLVALLELRWCGKQRRISEDSTAGE